MAKLNLQQSKSSSTKKESSQGGTASKKVMDSSLMQQKSQQQASLFRGVTIQKQANETGLPDNLKSGMESLSGVSLDDVKVHYNSPKPATVQAYAYAQGNDIHLASGQEKHLPHELGHVVQQKQGRVKPTKNVGGIAVNDSKSLENEATQMGNKALQMKPKGVTQLAQKQPQGVMQKVSITSKEFKKYIVTGRPDKENKAVLKGIDEENALIDDLKVWDVFPNKELQTRKDNFDIKLNSVAYTVIPAAMNKKKRKASKKPFYRAMQDDIQNDYSILTDIVEQKKDGEFPEGKTIKEVFDTTKSAQKMNYEEIPFSDGGILKLANEYRKQYLTAENAVDYTTKGLASINDQRNKPSGDKEAFDYDGHDNDLVDFTIVGAKEAASEIKSIGKTVVKVFKKSEKAKKEDIVKGVGKMASVVQKAAEVAHKYLNTFSKNTMGHLMPITDAIKSACETLLKFKSLYDTYKNSRAVILELEAMDKRNPKFAEASEHYRKQHAREANKAAIKAQDEKELHSLKAELLDSPDSKKLAKQVQVRKERLGLVDGVTGKYEPEKIEEYSKDGTTIKEEELKHYNALKAIVEATKKQINRRSMNLTSSLMETLADLSKAAVGLGTTFALALKSGSKALKFGAMGVRMGKQYQRDKKARKMAKGKNYGTGWLSKKFNTSKSSAAKEAYRKARAKDLVEILTSNAFSISRKKAYVGALRLDLKKITSDDTKYEDKIKMVLVALKERD